MPVLGGTGLRWLGRDPALPDSAAARAFLACLATLHPVQLNGRAVTPRYRFFNEPGSGRRGIVGFIPARDLPAGENLLRVEAIGRPVRRPPAPFEIPFRVERPGSVPTTR